MMVSKVKYPQMAALFRLVNYSNLNGFPFQTSSAMEHEKNGTYSMEVDVSMLDDSSKTYRTNMYLVLNPLFSYSTRLIPFGNIGLYYVDLDVFPFFGTAVLLC